MARLTGPLFSLGASGTIADTLTYASWKGIPYVRTRVIPANPNTAEQQEVRGVFITLNEMWKRMPQMARDPWVYAVRGRPLTARNRHIQENIPWLIDAAVLNSMIFAVNLGGAIALATAPGVDGADGTITCTCTPNTAPVGYTIHSCVGAAFLQGVPGDGITRTCYVNQDVAAPFALVVNVPADGNYIFGAWPIYTRDSDGTLFNGGAINTLVAVTGN